MQYSIKRVTDKILDIIEERTLEKCMRDLKEKRELRDALEKERDLERKLEEQELRDALGNKPSPSWKKYKQRMDWV